MASFFDEYEYDVNDFNVRYGINFSFEAFETSHLRLDREKIVVDDSVVIAHNNDAPKTESVKGEELDPTKERIVLNELSEKTSGKDVSAKVEENDVPVVSNVKE